MLHSMVASPRLGDQPSEQCNSETLVTSLLPHTEQESPGREQGTAWLQESCPLGGEDLLTPLTKYCLLLLEVSCEALGGQAQGHIPCAQ